MFELFVNDFVLCLVPIQVYPDSRITLAQVLRINPKTSRMSDKCEHPAFPTGKLDSQHIHLLVFLALGP